ncbi:phage portal protein [Pediococcus argentinicus]|uniref:phage portal protein n=1 Tax=Pediococcus argentinicus TaxID=480391 RepID=UPI00338F0CFD
MPINPFRGFKRSQTLPSNYVPFQFVDGKIITNPTVDATTALQNSDIFSVVSLISSQLASITYDMPAPYSAVFNNPNDRINSYSFWSGVIAQLCLTGNAYVVINRNGNNMPSSLEEIPPENVSVILADKSANITYDITYNDLRPKHTFSSSDVLHFRLFVPGSQMYQYVGVSPLQSLVSEIGLQKLSGDLNFNTLKNFIAPSYTLTVPEAKLNSETKDAIRDKFQEQNSGENQGKAIVLDQAAQLGVMPTIDAKTAQFLNNVDWTRKQISKAFGIPDSYLNGAGDQQSSLDQITKLFATSLNRYINPFVSELQLKFGTTVRPDLTAIFDPYGNAYVDMIEKLSTGSAPVLNPEQAIAALKGKGVLNIDN